MREYKFKRGYPATQERLESLLKKHFGEFRKYNDFYIVSFGAVEELKIKLEEKKKRLLVSTKTKKNVSDDLAVKTIRTYNKFLEELTGYTAKERQKMLRKEVEKLE